MALGRKEIENRFGLHRSTIEGPNIEPAERVEARRNFIAFAMWMDETLPDGRAKSIAFTELENASMWTHKAIDELAPLVNE